jgi:hypothetical protein
VGLTVEFNKSEKIVAWEDRFETIPDLAEKHGMDIAINT